MAEHADSDVHPPPGPVSILALMRSNGCIGRSVLGGVGTGGRHRWVSVVGSAQSIGFAGNG